MEYWLDYRRFRIAVRAALAIFALLGAWLLVHPQSLAALLGETHRLGDLGTRAAGLALILFALAAAPAAVVARANRLLGLQPAMAGAALGLFFLVAGGGFWLPGAVLLAVAVGLLWTFWLDYRSHLMSLP
jgi:hypothetical protein